MGEVNCAVCPAEGALTLSHYCKNDSLSLFAEGFKTKLNKNEQPLT